MGSDRHYPEEAPAHRGDGRPVLDRPHHVTNAEFRRFVKATGYVTVAERAPDPRSIPARSRRRWCPARWCSAAAGPVD